MATKLQAIANYLSKVAVVPVFIHQSQLLIRHSAIVDCLEVVKSINVKSIKAVVAVNLWQVTKIIVDQFTMSVMFAAVMAIILEQTLAS